MLRTPARIEGGESQNHPTRRERSTKYGVMCDLDETLLHHDGSAARSVPQRFDDAAGLASGAMMRSARVAGVIVRVTGVEQRTRQPSIHIVLAC